MSKIKVLFICHGRREGLPKAAKSGDESKDVAVFDGGIRKLVLR